MTDNKDPWYHISMLEFFVALLPPGLGLVLALMISGDDGSPLHGLIALLTLPGFLILTILRLIFRFGSLHGDQWDLLSIPLSAAFMLLAIRGVHRIRDQRDADK